MNLISAIKLELKKKYGDELIILVREEDKDNFEFRIRNLTGIARIIIETNVNSKVEIKVRFSTNLRNFGRFEESFKQVVSRIVDSLEINSSKLGFLSVKFEYPYLSTEEIVSFVEILDEIFREFNQIGLIFERLDSLNL